MRVNVSIHDISYNKLVEFTTNNEFTTQHVSCLIEKAHNNVATSKNPKTIKYSHLKAEDFLDSNGKFHASKAGSEASFDDRVSHADASEHKKSTEATNIENQSEILTLCDVTSNQYNTELPLDQNSLASLIRDSQEYEASSNVHLSLLNIKLL